MRTVDTKRVIFSLAVLGGLTLSGPAKASTFQFVVPSALIQSAITNALNQVGSDPNLYAFYDVYLRPAIDAEVPLIDDAYVANNQSGQVLPNYSIVDFASPLPSGPDMYTATAPVVAPPDGSVANVRFTFAGTDTVEALLSTNINVVGQVYVTTPQSMTAELMPASNFSITISSAPAFSGAVRFAVNAVGYQFANSQALPSGVVDKPALVTGYFDAIGSEVPEPGVLFTMGTGLALLTLLAGRRRNSTIS